MKSEAWRAGYAEGRKPAHDNIVAITPPEHFTPEQRGDFAAGFAVGAKAAWNDRIIDELQAGGL